MNEFACDERANRHSNVIISTGDVEYTSTLHYIDDGNYRVAECKDSEWLDLGIVDVEAETESMRQEAEVRLQARSNELKRFHDKICRRVTERERQNRLKAQRVQKYLDAKCAKLFSTTKTKHFTENTSANRVSSRPYFQKLKENTKSILKDCPLGKHIEKILHLDAQIRDDLLRSTEISRSHHSTSDEYEHDGGRSFSSESAESPVLLPEQRVALYATVRRQYMEMNRAKIQNNVWRGASQTSRANQLKSPLSNSSVAAAVRDSRARCADNPDHKNIGERWDTSTGVKVYGKKYPCLWRCEDVKSNAIDDLNSIDMTSGCDVRVHRQTTTSSTPWRKKSAKGPTTQKATTEHERFLQALQAQLGTPALCSCAKAEPTSFSSSQPCANNCTLYKQPKKREKLLASVYKQQQQDIATAAASPIR